MNTAILSLIASTVGATAGAAAAWGAFRYRIGGHKQLGQEILQSAEIEAEAIRKESELAIRQAELEHRKELDEQRRGEPKKLRKEEDRLKTREDKVEKRLSLLEKTLSDVERREVALDDRKTQLEKESEALAAERAQLTQELERLSGMTPEEAKALLLESVSADVTADAAALTRHVIGDAEEAAEAKARRIIATAINRFAVSQASDVTISTVPLPNEEMKARIVGREGRNIRALEQATGVNFVLDETPEAVIISGFDPIRKHIAKVALSELIVDGRIHPTRITEAVNSARSNVDRQILAAGEDAATRSGAVDLHKELVLLLGRLKFRYSLGQNVLEHSLEVSHLMGMMASELGLDPALAKRIGLLHDIGKAAPQEMEGTHALIGHDLCLRHGESPDVANGVGCHHGEISPETIEGSLCGAADAISASRPGARVEAINEYVRRLRKLEDIAFEFPAVEKAYALQAGRELRVAVLPDMIDDAGAVNLARDLSRSIQQKVRYSGRIKVTIVREKRCVEYAV